MTTPFVLDLTRCGQCDPPRTHCPSQRPRWPESDAHRPRLAASSLERTCDVCHLRPAQRQGQRVCVFQGLPRRGPPPVDARACVRGGAGAARSSARWVSVFGRPLRAREPSWGRSRPPYSPRARPVPAAFGVGPFGRRRPLAVRANEVRRRCARHTRGDSGADLQGGRRRCRSTRNAAVPVS
jgi:hypothetical protein